MAAKPKIGKAVKAVTSALGIEQCANCEERQFIMDRWTHKKPIAKLDHDEVRTESNTADLYFKYFGLDNRGTTNQNVIKAMNKDLDKLFQDAN